MSNIREVQDPEIKERTGYGREEETEENHPAFGVAVVSRVSGTPRTLFQSDIQHQETIRLSISTAVRYRSLMRDWIHPKKELIEIEVSLAQWGALISSGGIGSGTPVTIRRTEQEVYVPGLPYQPRIAENLRETKQAVTKLLERVRRSAEAVAEAIEQKKGVKAVRDALSYHKSVIANAESNAGFAVKSLKEAAEDVTNQAKADIEAHILEAARLTGHSPVSVPELTEFGAQEAIGPGPVENGGVPLRHMDD